MPVNAPIFVVYMLPIKQYFTPLLLLISMVASAQEEPLVPPVPAMRQLHHEYIIRSLEKIDSLHLSEDKIASKKMLETRWLVTGMRAAIEKNEKLSDNVRYKWLRGVNEVLTGFITAWQAKNIPAEMYPDLIESFDASMRLEWNEISIEPIIKAGLIETGNILVENFALKDNIGLAAAKDVLVLKQCQKSPLRILPILSRYPRNRYADSLITAAGLRDPEELYSYAAASNAFGKKIQSVNHPFVKLVSRLALTRTGRMYFPFLDNIYKGVTPMDSITPFVISDTSLGYYKLLVKTRIQYAERMQHGDTPMAVKTLTAKLKSKAIEGFINEINALHNNADSKVRFKKLEGLSPVELYYLAVLGEQEIYTSSFVSGVYPRIFSRMAIPRSDSLLLLVKHDYYKKFIKIAAAYNVLDDFLGRMDQKDAEQLIIGFVDKLDRTNSLEDAVDVADSYASIYNPELRKLILFHIQHELQRCKDQNAGRGEIIYSLLKTIFLSLDSTSNIDIAATLGIMPVYELPLKSLMDRSSGRIVMQQFFYGDKDGGVVFNAFLNKFRNANWKIVKKSQWVEVISVKGSPVTIYSNLPLDEKLELDEQSQDSLIDYLDQQNIHPAIVIHRGHSYYVNHTIKKLPHTAKLILLGSCGGYQKLNEVLDICEGAHIISSKQVGTGIINQGLIDVISEKLRTGNDLNWPAIWSSMAGRFNGSAKEKFEDYIPPYRNLGAIFITAYTTKMQGE